MWCVFLHYYSFPLLHYRYALCPELFTQISYASETQATITLIGGKNCLHFDPLPVQYLSVQEVFIKHSHYAIYSSVLDHGRAVICKKTARQGGTITTTQKTHVFLLILLLLSRDVQLNPGIRLGLRL